MAGRIRQEDVAAVRERTDIVAVIGQQLQLKKAGRDSLVGICPFHPEKTPSFSVSPSKQVYYCFGCGEGGDVFRFVSKTENLSFAEAVERLAATAGVTLRYEGETRSDRRAQGRRQALHRAIADAAKLYQRMLVGGREAADARDYLGKRGISQGSVERFGIGYAPGYADFLLRRLTKSYSAELLVEAGLVTKDDRGDLRDRFRGRVMFPIHDLSGSAVGFGGRLLAGEHAPANAAKYVNSAESPVYHKGSLLYNLNRAKADITHTGRAFLVEGYTDVIGLDQAGVHTAVATCGTALGEDHARLLARFTEKVVLAFDSDEAGARAAERAYQFHQRYAIDISVLVLPEGQDPADFVLAHGPAEEAGARFLELADGATPLVVYMIDRALRGRDLSNPEERARAIRDGLALVTPLEEPVRRDEYARILAGKVGESERAVLLQMERMPASTAPAATPVAPTNGNGDGNGSHRLGGGRLAPDEEVEREVLKLLVHAPQLCARADVPVDGSKFAKPTHRKVFELLHESAPPGTAPSIAALVDAARQRPNGEQLASFIARLANDVPYSDGPPTIEYARRLLLRLEEFALKREADAVRKQLERLNPIKQPTDHETLFEQLVALEGARRRARAAAEAVGS